MGDVDIRVCSGINEWRTYASKNSATVYVNVTFDRSGSGSEGTFVQAEVNGTLVNWDSGAQYIEADGSFDHGDPTFGPSDSITLTNACDRVRFAIMTGGTPSYVIEYVDSYPYANDSTPTTNICVTTGCGDCEEPTVCSSCPIELFAECPTSVNVAIDIAGTVYNVSCPVVWPSGNQPYYHGFLIAFGNTYDVFVGCTNRTLEDVAPPIVCDTVTCSAGTYAWYCSIYLSGVMTMCSYLCTGGCCVPLGTYTFTPSGNPFGINSVVVS